MPSQKDIIETLRKALNKRRPNEEPSQEEQLEQDEMLFDILKGNIKTAVLGIIEKREIVLRDNELYGSPDEKIRSRLKDEHGYELETEFNGWTIMKGAYSILDPYYYMPQLKKGNQPYQKIDADYLKLLVILMPDGNRNEQIAVLSETIDMPADELVYMMNGE